MSTDPAFRERYGPWALVTGAAQGLGEAFARQLAARGLNLLLNDKQEAKLTQTAAALRAEFGVETRPLACDLSQADCRARLCAAAQEIEIGLLVNNAAASRIQPFLDAPLEAHRQILSVNVQTPLELAHCLGQAMCARRRGGMIFVSSASAIAGTGWVASYAASKAFNWNLAESLWAELRPHGVDVLALVAGNMDTPAWRQSTPRPDEPVWPPVQPPETAAREALAALGKRPMLFAPGWQNRLVFTLVQRFLPRRRLIDMLYDAMQKRYGSN